jgi:hypothetical protein
MQRLLSRRFWLFGLVLVLPLSIGCGAAQGTVWGTVSYRDKALDAGTVLLFTEQGKIYSCLIGADGGYRLSEIPPGPARLAVVSHGETPPGLQGQAPPTHPTHPGSADAGTERKPMAIPEKYGDPVRSGLVLKVAAGDQAFNIVMRP